MSRPCKWCDSREHTQFYCRQKPRKPIPKISKKRLANPPEPKPKKPIKAKGKKANQLDKTSKEWKEVNPPDFQGYWYCKVGGAALTDGKQDTIGGLRLNLCHDISRARDSTKSFNLDNIFPGCGRHNKEQGSKSLEEYLSTNYIKMCGNS